MFFGDKKPAMALLVGKGKSPETETPDDGSVGLEVAAEDILGAVKSNDAKLLASALKDAFAMLKGSETEEVETESEEM